MQYFYQFEKYGSPVAVFMFLTGAIILCRRRSSPAAILQVIGAAFMATTAILGFVLTVHVDLKTQRMNPEWLWDLEQLLSFAGMILFAAGYLIERITVPRNLD